jgi:hypothetical protein
MSNPGLGILNHSAIHKLDAIAVLKFLRMIAQCLFINLQNTMKLKQEISKRLLVYTQRLH